MDRPRNSNRAADSAVAGIEKTASEKSKADIVKEVHLEGNFKTEPSKLPKLGTRQGEPFNLHVVQEDMRTLAASRKFIDVKSECTLSHDGIIVTFKVIERPTIEEIIFIGNQDVRSQTLRKKSELEKKEPLDPYAVEEGRRRLEAYYRDKGYSHAQITTIDGIRPLDRKVVFLVDEGTSNHKFRNISEGNTIASNSQLHRLSVLTSMVSWRLTFKSIDRRSTMMNRNCSPFIATKGSFKRKSVILWSTMKPIHG